MIKKIVRFTISAVSTLGLREATRLNAYSAMVLGDRWATEGFWNIRITDPCGIERDLPAFRQTLLMLRRIALRLSPQSS